MCYPGSPYKTTEELASAARRHLAGYRAAKKELEARGHKVILYTCDDYRVKIFYAKKESL